MLTIQTVTDLQWCDAEHTFLTCNVKYAEFNEVHPSGINGIDPYPHIREIWNNANAGVYGPIAEYIPPIEVEEVLATPENQPTVNGAQTL